jgi:hypothetical protein
MAQRSCRCVHEVLAQFASHACCLRRSLPVSLSYTPIFTRVGWPPVLCCVPLCVCAQGHRKVLVDVNARLPAVMGEGSGAGDASKPDSAPLGPTPEEVGLELAEQLLADGADVLLGVKGASRPITYGES